MDQSRFPQRHKIDNIGIIVNFVFLFISSSILYLYQMVSKGEIMYQLLWEDYISRL